MKGALSWQFVQLYILTLMFFSANAILNVFVPLKGHDIGASNAAIGIVMGAYMLTAMVFRPWAGQMISKLGPIKILRIILVVNGLALILYGFVGFEGYIVARIMQGVCTAFFSMSLQLGIIDALPEEDRAQGISLYSLFSYIPLIIGPLIALQIWHADQPFVFAGTMVFIAVMTFAFGYRATFNGSNDVPEEKKNEQASFNSITVFAQYFKNKYLFKSALIMLCASIVFGALTTFIPIYLSEITVGHAGVFLMIQAIAVVLSRFYLRKYIPSDGVWHRGFMAITLGLIAVAVLFVGLAPQIGFIPLYLGAVLVGIAQAMIYPTLTSYLSFVLAKHERNMLIGLFIASADLGVSLGSIVMGPIADAFNYSVMYIVCAVLIGIIILYSVMNKTGERTA